MPSKVTSDQEYGKTKKMSMFDSEIASNPSLNSGAAPTYLRGALGSGNDMPADEILNWSMESSEKRRRLQRHTHDPGAATYVRDVDWPVEYKK
jgi:hypothetical protein